MIDRVMTVYRDLRGQTEERLWTLVMAKLCQASRAAFSDLLLSFKHRGFKHEKEWRLVFPSYRWEDSAEFRIGATGLVPYLRVKLCRPFAAALQGLPAEARDAIEGLPAEARDAIESFVHSLPLAEVVQGPTAEPALANEALERFLKGLRFHGVKTRLSEVPLRF
jgi:hypothetical protein